MTLILAAKTKDGIIMAGDRYEGGDMAKHLCVMPKIADKDGILLGAAGNSLQCLVLIDLMILPERKPHQDVLSYIIYSLAPNILLELEAAKVYNPREEAPKEQKLEVEILIGIDGRIFELGFGGDTLQNCVEVNTVGAVGCAVPEALATYKALGKISKASVKTKILTTMSAIEETNAYVSYPFDLLEI